MFLDATWLSKLYLVMAGFGVAFIAALWLSLIIWTYRDIRSRARDRLVYFLASILVAILFIPGLLIYLVIRPRQTLEEEYQTTLEEEAMLQAIEEQVLCPGCERKTKDNWIICPTCQTRLKKTCHHCGQLMDLPWTICPFCGTPALGYKHSSDADMQEEIKPIPSLEIRDGSDNTETPDPIQTSQ